MNMAIEIERDSSRRNFTRWRIRSDGHGNDDIFHVTFSPRSESVTQELVSSVATIKNTTPLQLTPLGSCVDVEMLESLVDPDSNPALHGSEICIEYEGLHITVSSEGDIWLEWSEDSNGPRE